MGSLFFGLLGWHGVVAERRAMSAADWTAQAPAEQLSPRQVIALRKGWSDANGGLQRRSLAVSLRASYERGYRGGTAFAARTAA